MQLTAELQQRLLSIAAKLNELKITEGTTVRFRGWGSTYLTHLLLHSVGIGDDIPEAGAFVICREAISAAAANGTITPQSLHREVSVGVSRYRGRSERLFALVTPLSVDPPEGFRYRSIDGWQISVEGSLPREFDRSFLEATPVGSWQPYVEPTRWIIARGSARTEDTAAHGALRAIDLLRGVWSLAHGAAIRSPNDFGGPHRPLGPILLGPVHTLHGLSGAPSPPGYWFDPAYRPSEGPAWPLQSEGWNAARELEDRIEEGVLLPPMRSFVTEGLVRYCRALDAADPEVTFVDLWGTLEHVAARRERERTDVILDRIANLYSDREPLTKQMLRMLRDQRDASVHRGVSSEFRRSAISMLAPFTSDCLVFLLRAHDRFGTPEQFREFLSLPPDRASLDEGIALRRLAKELRGMISDHSGMQGAGIPPDEA